MTSKTKLVDPKILVPFILVTSCFAWWGLANNMTDTLLSAFKRIKSMSDLQTSLIQFAFYGAYFCFALPAALYIKRYSFKSGVLLGLALFIAGGLLFYPASLTQEYWHFLLALYILAGGLSILETSANPYIMALGPKETATQRLNLAQSFNPIGSISGVVISKYFILSNLQEFSAADRAAMSPESLQAIQTSELTAVMNPYVIVSFILILTWLAIAFSKMPKIHDSSQIHFGPSFKRLFANKNYVFGVVAQFFYVGAQIGVWSFTIRYVMQELHINEDGASSYYIAALIVFTISRFAGTALMSVMSPGRVLKLLSLIAILATLTVITTGGMVGVVAQISISACMSVMFPTIYGNALQTVGEEDLKLGGSGLIMAILGGALMTPIQGLISDNFGIQAAFSIPLICFGVVWLFAHQNIRVEAQISKS